MAKSNFRSTIPFRKERKTSFFEFPLAMLDAPVFWLGRQRVRVTNDATEDAAAAVKLHDAKTEKEYFYLHRFSKIRGRREN